MSIRKAAVAGSWYPAKPDALRAEIDRYLETAEVRTVGTITAIIAPHAGLLYSGPVAAFSYKLVRDHSYDVAVLVGPSHYVGFNGVAIYERGAFETPLGRVPIAETCAAAIATAGWGVKAHPSAHVREHSLEMQLPFLQRALPDVPIVPLVMGYQTRETIQNLSKGLVAALTGRNVLLIASTDLSHYHDAATAARLDGEVIKHVEAFDAEALLSALDRFPHHACGGGPTVSVMQTARALGARDTRILKYANSGDVSGDHDAVVGYLAAALGNFQTN